MYPELKYMLFHCGAVNHSDIFGEIETTKKILKAMCSILLCVSGQDLKALVS